MESQKYWFVCPICGFDKMCKVDENCKGGVHILCKKCDNEIEVKYQGTQTTKKNFKLLKAVV
jgi:transcription elongation factor Elf1